MNISVSYSFDHEVARIFGVGQEIDWYMQHGYKPLLPAGITYENVASLSKLKIIEALSGIYHEDDYAAAKHELMRSVEKYHVPFGEKLAVLNLPIETRYEVVLTKYGTGGSYDAPHTVIMNITGKFGIGPMKTVMHEITHLVIQPLIEKYNVGHWEKERIVDLIMSRVGPFDPPIMQNVPGGIPEKVDGVFNKYYPHIEQIVEGLKGE